MLTIFRGAADVARKSSLPELPRDVIWIDLMNPTKEETTFVESRARVRIPSIEMLGEIETSSRLAVDHGVVYLSIPAVAQGDTADAYLSPTGFILTNRGPCHDSIFFTVNIRCRHQASKAGRNAPKFNVSLCHIAGSNGGSWG